MKNKFYITAPIYYINSNPHIGSLYSTLIADVISRIMKIIGKDVVFLTGADEHGQKIYEAAKKNNIDKKTFLDNLVEIYKKTWKEWNIEYDIFMRTTDDYHKKAVQQWIINLQKKDLIYKGIYEGWYSITSENFILEKDIELKNEYGIPLCPISKQPAIWLRQEAYFFKLSLFADRLLKFYKENPKFITPYEKLEEIISFVKNGLNDLCISRSKKELTWGIPFPGDDEHVVYVWADALNNYITGIGYLQENKKNDFNRFWPCDLHVLGKDISRFHAVYWPAFLMASNLELPIREMVHGWILSGNEKMSKSLGNVILPEEIKEKYGVDICRYYIIRHLAITHDSNFSVDDLEIKSDAELANTLGNLIQRVITLCLKNNLHKINFNYLFVQNESLYKNSLLMIDEFKKEIELKTYMLHKLYSDVWKFINSINSYLNEKQPWKEKDIIKFENIMSVVLDSIFKISIIIWPLIPESSQIILNYIGLKKENNEFYKLSEIENNYKQNYIFNLKNINEPIFKKFIQSKQQAPEQEEAENKVKNEIKKISFDIFSTIFLLVGEIIQAEEIQNSDKLYKLTVNFGEHGDKIICSGIKKYYKIDELINKKAIFVFNLEPRKICGYNSEGMILTTSKENIPSIIIVDNLIKNGTKLS